MILILFDLEEFGEPKCYLFCLSVFLHPCKMSVVCEFIYVAIISSHRP